MKNKFKKTILPALCVLGCHIPSVTQAMNNGDHSVVPHILIPDFPSSTAFAAPPSHDNYEDAKYELPHLSPEENQARQKAARKFLWAEINDLFEQHEEAEKFMRICVKLTAKEIEEKAPTITRAFKTISFGTINERKQLIAWSLLRDKSDMIPWIQAFITHVVPHSLEIIPNDKISDADKPSHYNNAALEFVDMYTEVETTDMPEIVQAFSEVISPRLRAALPVAKDVGRYDRDDFIGDVVWEVLKETPKSKILNDVRRLRAGLASKEINQPALLKLYAACGNGIDADSILSCLK